MLGSHPRGSGSSPGGGILASLTMSPVQTPVKTSVTTPVNTPAKTQSLAPKPPSESRPTPTKTSVKTPQLCYAPAGREKVCDCRVGRCRIGVSCSLRLSVGRSIRLDGRDWGVTLAWGFGLGSLRCLLLGSFNKCQVKQAVQAPFSVGRRLCDAIVASVCLVQPVAAPHWHPSGHIPTAELEPEKACSNLQNPSPPHPQATTQLHSDLPQAFQRSAGSGTWPLLAVSIRQRRCPAV